MNNERSIFLAFLKEMHTKFGFFEIFLTIYGENEYDNNNKQLFAAENNEAKTEYFFLKNNELWLRVITVKMMNSATTGPVQAASMTAVVDQG